MSDELALFVVLGLVYLSDCVTWIGSSSVAFVSRTGSRWVRKAASDLIRTADGGLLLLNPLPPLGSIFCCHLLPIVVAPDGASMSTTSGSSIRGDDPGSGVIPLDGSRALETRGRDLLLDGRRFTRCRDSRQAEQAWDLLNRVRTASPEARATILDRFWEDRFDFTVARNRLEAAGAALGSLRKLCNALFLYLFLAAPAVVFFTGRVDLLIPLGVGMVVQAVWISIRFNALFRKLSVAATEDRVTHLIKMLLCPPAAIRACDPITEHLLSDFHPLVVARLILSPDRYRALAAETLRSLRFPIVAPSEGGYAGPAAWQNDLLLRRATRFLSDSGLSEADLLAPPEPEGPDVAGYCPRCLEQFREGDGECPDCSGVRRVSFSVNPGSHRTGGEA